MIRPVAGALGGCLRADPVDEALGSGWSIPRSRPGSPARLLGDIRRRRL